MLTVHISYSDKSKLEESLLKSGFKKTANSFILETTSQKELARTQGDENNTLTITFPKSLSLDEYRQIHEAISFVAEHGDVSVDDQGSQLGYLQNGEEAYILTNWNEWVLFLEKARHKSMEGQKVRVLTDNGFELGNGILSEYTLNDSLEKGFEIEKCILITTIGERTFRGPNIKLEPTGEW